MSDEAKTSKSEDKPKKSAAKEGVKVSLNPDFAAEGSVFISSADLDPADVGSDGRIEITAAGKTVSARTASALSACRAVKVGS
jgi:hypothetical protein